MLLKWKAKCVDTGGIVYGSSLIQVSPRKTLLRSDVDGVYYQVYKQSIRQLAYIDPAGNEVYEYETVLDDEGYEYTVNIEPNVDISYRKKAISS